MKNKTKDQVKADENRVVEEKLEPEKRRHKWRWTQKGRSGPH